MASIFASGSNRSLTALVLLVSLLAVKLDVAVGQIGVCYGMEGNLPPPREVVDLYRSRNIRAMRLYYPNQDALRALRGSNIQIILNVERDRIRELANNPAAADSWVQNNVRNYWPDVRFRYIAVGNEEIPGGNANSILAAMRNVYAAIQRAGLQGQIKVSTAVHQPVLANTFPPRNSVFSPQAAPIMGPIVRFLADTGAPLLANVYTYFSYRDSGGSIQLPYALFTSPSVVVNDPPYQYQNLFDALVDGFYWALEKAGAPNVGLVVSESGWPSAGEAPATIDNARTYNQNLIRHVGRGTPKRPGALETYVFAMFNEDRKQPEVEKHFGLFFPNKQPVYPITFP